jgi:hypothetical protein
MKKHLLFAVACSVFSLFLSRTSSATNYSLYLHGYSQLSGCGAQPGGWCYWQWAGQPGVNAIPVNYDGTVHLSQAAPTVINALNAYCTGANWCYVAAHSMGAAMLGYVYATTSHPWNIYWVETAGSAAGGSELANAVEWAVGSSTVNQYYRAIYDLQTDTMRGLYNHDAVGDYIAGRVYPNMGGDWAVNDTCMFPGGNNGFTAPCFGSTGGNDIVVAYHSSGHYRTQGTYTTAAANTTYGGTYWDWTTTSYVDDARSGGYYHTWNVTPWSGGSGPITNVMAGVMGSYAK